MMFEKLFSPIKINHVEIKNRLAMAPMYVMGLVEPNGSFSQRAIDYYEERAKGGTGLIISSVVGVEDEIEKRTLVLPIPNSFTKTNFRELAEAVHYFGAKLFIQLTAGFGRNAPFPPNVKPVSASAVPSYFDPLVTCRALTIDEIERMVKAFGDAALILADVGVDGVELHGHEGYLLDQFATALWNRRTDKYGCNLEGRLRFPVEILREIKSRAGKQFTVQYRYGVQHFLKGFDKSAVPGETFKEMGRDLTETIAMAQLLDEAGFDALHIDRGGSYNSYYWAHPPMYFDHGCGLDTIIGEIKKVVKVPVLVCSRFDHPSLAEKMVAEGKTDMVVIGRGLLADPYWPQKVWEGRIEDIRPCIACDTGCQGRMNIGGTVSCAVNPTTGKEKIWDLRPVRQQRKVLVVGGGIAGMEAVRVLAERGHSVSLYEKGNELGGHLIEGSVPEFKKDLRRLLAWYKTQLRKLNVEIVMNTEVTPAIVDKIKPHAVVVATGSKPIVPDIPGIKSSKVHTAVDVFLQKEEIRGSAVVVGGGLIGCEVALWLAQKGNPVTLIEKLPKLMPREIEHLANKKMLIDLLHYHGVEIRTETALAEVTDKGIKAIGKDLEVNSIECDDVVLAMGLKPEDALGKTLFEKGSTAYFIGDCKEPRLILNAIWDAYKVANSI